MILGAVPVLLPDTPEHLVRRGVDGDLARLSVPGIKPVDGTVEFVGSPSFVGMRTDDAMYMLIHGYNDMAFATAHYFDDRDPSTETEAWQNWLGGLAA